MPPLACPQHDSCPTWQTSLDLRPFSCCRAQPGYPCRCGYAAKCAAVAQICTLLDGIPLALELGAAATATFSVQEIAERLAWARAAQCGPGYRDAEPRQRSINDTVAWSYNLLRRPSSGCWPSFPSLPAGGRYWLCSRCARDHQSRRNPAPARAEVAGERRSIGIAVGAHA